MSATFRKGGDITFLVEELKSVFDPRGGYWNKGKYMPSIIALLLTKMPGRRMLLTVISAITRPLWCATVVLPV